MKSSLLIAFMRENGFRCPKTAVVAVFNTHTSSPVFLSFVTSDLRVLCFRLRAPTPREDLQLLFFKSYFTATCRRLSSRVAKKKKEMCKTETALKSV